MSELWNPHDCTHPNSIVCKYQRTDGVWIVRKQCLDCGGYCGDVKKNLHDLDKLPEWSTELVEEREQAAREYYEERRRDLQWTWESDREEESRHWWEKYERYLKSPEWAIIRQRVRIRDSAICQACLDQPAVQVHHLSYHNYNKTGHTFAHDCIAVCQRCHDLIHGAAIHDYP